MLFFGIYYNKFSSEGNVLIDPIHESSIIDEYEPKYDEFLESVDSLDSRDINSYEV